MQLCQCLLLLTLGPGQASQTPASDKRLGRLVMLQMPGQALLLLDFRLIKAAQFEQGPALIVVKGASQPRTFSSLLRSASSIAS